MKWRKYQYIHLYLFINICLWILQKSISKAFLLSAFSLSYWCLYHLFVYCRISLIPYQHQHGMSEVLYDIRGDDIDDDHLWKNYAITLPTGHYTVHFEFTMGDPLTSVVALDRVKLNKCSEIPDDFLKIAGRNVTGDFPAWHVWGRHMNSSPLDKMATISQTIFNCIFVNEKFVFWLKFHLSLFLMVQLTTTQHLFK